MAYNPHSFENIYGFSLLDEVHNFFPELLYDEGLFPNDSWRWIRHRVNHLFPHVYVRQQNTYNIYSAEQRMQTYMQWYRENSRFSDMPAPETRLPVLFPSLAVPPPPRAAVSVPPPVPAGGAGAAHGSQEQPSRTVLRSQTNTLPTLFTSLLFDMRAPRDQVGENILNLFNRAFIDVAVAPTHDQIDQASEIETIDRIPDEATCSICQEREGPPAWRILHCGHSYHQVCIDTWLTSHVQCPICRMDVRTMHPPTRT